jgi:hypothetical protein
VEGFLEVSFVPCLGDENRHEPYFCSLLADREGMGHLVFLGYGLSSGRDGFSPSLPEMC